MSIRLMLFILLFGQCLLAFAPRIECRFEGLLEGGAVGLDEVVDIIIAPGEGVAGDFEPYGFDISVYGTWLNISVDIADEPISGIQFPIDNILHLPVGFSLFGINTVYHDPSLDFISVRYECIKLY